MSEAVGSRFPYPGSGTAGTFLRPIWRPVSECQVYALGLSTCVKKAAQSLQRICPCPCPASCQPFSGFLLVLSLSIRICLIVTCKCYFHSVFAHLFWSQVRSLKTRWTFEFVYSNFTSFLIFLKLLGIDVP